MEAEEGEMPSSGVPPTSLAFADLSLDRERCSESNGSPDALDVEGCSEVAGSEEMAGT